MSSIVRINDHDISITGRLVREARLQEEWFEELGDPEAMIAALKRTSPRADVFTFWQRLPDVEPRYSYHREPDDVAALRIQSYDDWWSRQLASRTRGLVRKSAKLGVVVTETEYTDDFVRGMTSIFNETPIRQGRRFWHYGKDFETLKRQFSRCLFREKIIGAYLNDELIGFMMIGFADRYVVVGQIISKIRHRDKATNNALMAKAVEICARDKMPYLVYLSWGSGSLAEFKRRNGFERMTLPRYYVPLTVRGELALKLGVHKGFRHLIPQSTQAQLKQLRTKWYVAVEGLRGRTPLTGESEI